VVLIGAHIRGDDPVASAAELDAQCVQVFLADPQGWKKPVPRDDAAAIVESGLGVYAHAPYLVNVASTNNRIRIPSRNMIAQHAAAAASLGARGLIVHGGHVGDGDDIAVGIDNWRKTFERATFPVRVLVENTAGGENACARTLDRIALLWDAIGGYDVGFCLDTCHAAIEFESADDTLDRLAGAGIGIHKIQLSTGLRLPEPSADSLEALSAYDEPVYLHQVVAQSRGGRLLRFSDLPEALRHREARAAAEWRVHFHVPLYRAELGAFGNTQAFLARVLERQRKSAVSAQLEVETYTWDVLPPDQRVGGVVASIARELDWVTARLAPATTAPTS